MCLPLFWSGLVLLFSISYNWLMGRWVLILKRLKTKTNNNQTYLCVCGCLAFLTCCLPPRHAFEHYEAETIWSWNQSSIELVLLIGSFFVNCVPMLWGIPAHTHTHTAMVSRRDLLIDREYISKIFITFITYSNRNVFVNVRWTAN